MSFICFGLVWFSPRFLPGQEEHLSIRSPVLQIEQATLQFVNILRYVGLSQKLTALFISDLDISDDLNSLKSH